MSIILVGGWYFLSKTPDDSEGINDEVFASDHLNATYFIDGESFALIDGSVEKEATPESVSKIITKYFGNEVRTDLNDDGREDIVFLLTQQTGRSGTFFYVVAALNTEDGWQGSQAILLGDRIAPQTTEVSQNPSHKSVIVVNYVDRKPGEPMSTQPSVWKSIWLKLDLQSMQFGEVVQNFEGEADPNIMTLDMQTWKWIKTTYNDDTEIIPKNTEAFIITFKEDNIFSATTDCNTMSGGYEIKDNQITFKDVATTRMFCEGSQEQEFGKMLSEVQSYFFTSRGELILELKLDSGFSIFR